MHYLDRTAVGTPTCLSHYNYGTQIWDDLGGTCKQELRAALAKMQGIPGVTTVDAAEYGVRCAYCEGVIRHDGHIEHFRRKNPLHFPELTFAWTNLFLACGSQKHCGHYKDRKGARAYDPTHLIKPDDHDPEQFLYFHSNGEVRVNASLSDLAEQRRATATIRVFGLDNSALAGARANAVSVYRNKILNELEEIESWSPEDRMEYLQCEIEATRWDPYATTIKHFLLKNH